MIKQASCHILDVLLNESELIHEVRIVNVVLIFIFKTARNLFRFKKNKHNV